MRVWPLVIGGGAIAYWWSRRGAARNAGEAPAGYWVWPVASWNGRRPVISDGFGSPRPGGIRHGGVDVMFARKTGDTFVAGSVNASRGFVMPDGISAVAAADGVVWSAMQTPRGFAVVIDHAPQPFATFYTHLEKLLVSAKQPVRAGDPVGIVGFDPLDAAKLMHLHFELWRGGPANAIDPAPAMQSWDIVTAGVRNASALQYRPVGASGEAYPQWVRDLKDASGVYIIREDGEIVYVGSSVGRMYDTLTRHFQTWRRYKGFWKGQYAEGHDPGLTYRRDRVEVAVRTTRPDDALDEEARLIERLRPRDNLLGQPDDDVPF